MAYANPKLIEKWFSEYLYGEESMVSIGVFKKVPSTGWLLLTKGMAWLLSQQFYVGVTDRRLIILPASRNKRQDWMQDNMIYAGFDEVEFYGDALNNTILDVHKIYEGEPLKLRFKPGYQFHGMDQFDFIAAVKQGKNSHAESVIA